MAFQFSTDRRRVAAEPMQPIIDPAGWYPAQLAASDEWLYRLSGGEVDELRAAVDAIQSQRLAIKDITRDSFDLPGLGPALDKVRDELLEGRGFILIRGVPVDDFTREQSAIAYWCIAAHLGRVVSQNAKGHLLGHVKDIGGDYSDQQTRGYVTKAAMGFHADRCDYVGLMCIHPAMKGGESRIASGVTLYNEMLKACPDLVAELVEEFCWTRHGEIPPGKGPWYGMPVFGFAEGHFTIRGVSSHIFKSQGMEGVPEFTPLQREAFDVYREMVQDIAFDMDFQQGDIQFLHNHVTLHSRRGFEDWPDPAKRRHLFRLWICDEAGRPLLPAFREHIRGNQCRGPGAHHAAGCRGSGLTRPRSCRDDCRDHGGDGKCQHDRNQRLPGSIGGKPHHQLRQTGEEKL